MNEIHCGTFISLGKAAYFPSTTAAKKIYAWIAPKIMNTFSKKNNININAKGIVNIDIHISTISIFYCTKYFGISSNGPTILPFFRLRDDNSKQINYGKGKYTKVEIMNGNRFKK